MQQGFSGCVGFGGVLRGGFFGGVSGCKMQAGFRAWSFMLEGVFEVKGFRVWGVGPGCFNSLKF